MRRYRALRVAGWVGWDFGDATPSLGDFPHPHSTSAPPPLPPRFPGSQLPRGRCCRIGRRWLSRDALIKMNALWCGVRVSSEANWFSISSPVRRGADGFAWLRICAGGGGGLSGFISISDVVANFRSVRAATRGD